MDINEENMALRKLLWLNHGCGFGALYGDDGEMQCHRCMLDFKRSSVEIIDQRIEETRRSKCVEKNNFWIEDSIS